MIRFEHVCKRYGATAAVRSLDLAVGEGELFGFLGPNGAGKTTTIRMATGLLRPTSGRVLVGGVDVYADGTRARAMTGYVPDRPYLYDKLTGAEYVRFVGELYGLTAAESRERSAELLELFELDGAQDALIESYSHGMRQKLAIASVLVHRPRVIFLDEPTTALDPRTARMVKEMLRALCDRGATVFMSTHVMEIAERMCDRVAIIDHGEIVAQGAVSELRERRGELRGAHKASLEDVFLALTGTSRSADWLQAFSDGAM